MFSLNTRVSVLHRSIALRSVPSEQRCVPADDFHFAPLRYIPVVNLHSTCQPPRHAPPFRYLLPRDPPLELYRATFQ